MNIYDSYIDAGQELNEIDKMTFYTAILEFLKYGREPNIEGTVKAMFIAIRPSLEQSRTAMENGKKGGRPKQTETQTETQTKPSENPEPNPDGTQTITQSEPRGKAKYKYKSNYKKETTPNGVVKKSERFSPPTPQEVRDYVQEQDIGAIDAQRFCDYYAAQGWKLANGNAMKDWRAAARNWMSRQNKQPYQSTKPKGGVLDDELRETIERLEQGARSSPG